MKREFHEYSGNSSCVFDTIFTRCVCNLSRPTELKHLLDYFCSVASQMAFCQFDIKEKAFHSIMTAKGCGGLRADHSLEAVVEEADEEEGAQEGLHFINESGKYYSQCVGIDGDIEDCENREDFECPLGLSQNEVASLLHLLPYARVQGEHYVYIIKRCHPERSEG